MVNRESKGSSIIDLPSEYVCVDIETTGLSYEYDCIIEVSASHVIDGSVTEVFSSLVHPNGFTELSPFIEQLTGITTAMLFDAPTPDKVFPQFFSFIGHHVLVGHNVNFDINFLYDACSEFSLFLKNDFIDTLRIARKVFPDLKHHRLSDIAIHLGIPHNNAHRADSDVLVTIACYEQMKAIVLNEQSKDDFIHSFCKNRVPYRPLDSILSCPDNVDITNPIYGKCVVFTGALSSMARKDALQIVANLGGIPSDSVTKKTNYLVVGNEDFAKTVKDGKSSKMKKADSYLEKGCDIMTLSEDTFFQMIDPFIEIIK